MYLEFLVIYMVFIISFSVIFRIFSSNHYCSVLYKPLCQGVPVNSFTVYVPYTNMQFNLLTPKYLDNIFSVKILIIMCISRVTMSCFIQYS